MPEHTNSNYKDFIPEAQKEITSCLNNMLSQEWTTSLPFVPKAIANTPSVLKLMDSAEKHGLLNEAIKDIVSFTQQLIKNLEIESLFEKSTTPIEKQIEKSLKTANTSTQSIQKTDIDPFSKSIND